MKASLLRVKNRAFLLPDTHNYLFPTYIIEHAELLNDLVDESNVLVKDIMNLSNFYPFSSPAPENKVKKIKEKLSEFREVTGIIGYPFDNHDAKLYAIDRKVEIVFELNLDDFHINHTA